MRQRSVPRAPLVASLLALSAGASGDEAIREEFTGAASGHDWQSFLGACLTAGDGSGSIPACDGHPYYGEALVGGLGGTLPDPAGRGALRFTNGAPGGFAQAGAVISGFTFPTARGLEVRFTSLTYRGNSGGAARDGADGISFFLSDGGYPPGDAGAFGGSLGYTCSNVNNDPKLHPDGTPRGFDGLAHAYLGLGIDEYGNFLNQADGTANGYGAQPSRIGLRGIGDITFAELAGRFEAEYPAARMSEAQKAAATQNTCRTGTIWDYARPTAPVNTGRPIADYAPIPGASKVLPPTLQIANEAAMTRGAAIPISYWLRITPAGLLSFSFSYNGGAYQPVITAQDLTATNGPLPEAFRFGFAGSSGGSSNIHEVLCFEAQPAPVPSGGADSDDGEAADATRVDAGAQLYFTSYDPGSWSGSLSARRLVVDPATKVAGLAPAARWDAACALAGLAAGARCPATGATGPVAARGSAARTILTWNGSGGVPFEFAALSSSQQNTIDAGDPAPVNADRVAYLRGDRSGEIRPNGLGHFRARDGVLGDIAGSGPTWVGAPSLPYPETWSDRIDTGASPPENSGPSYGAFKAANAARLDVVYVGANDGMLHGFRAGSRGAAGVALDTPLTPDDGAEVLAYLPNAVLGSIHSATNPLADFASRQYGHRYYVDATPGSGDLYYGGAWHTWLVGGLGAGGAAVYALDVTDPGQFSEANAARLVVGEWTPATLSCVGNAGCGANLGNTYGTPQIRRLHNGAWGVVFGNGLGSAGGAAGIFVISVDPGSGARSARWLPAMAGSPGNGIAFTTPADLDGDHITDYVYAGDLKGNVWRFDLTSSDPSEWAVSPAGPLFTTPAGQPITTRLVVASTPSAAGAPPRILIEFGTGQATPLTSTAPAGYAEGPQSLYGIWDWNLAAWNRKGSARYASLAAPQLVTPGSLLEQTVLAPAPDSPGVRLVSSHRVCWKAGAECPGGNWHLGWTLKLPGASEQVIFDPVLQGGALLIDTTIPPTSDPLACRTTAAAGWTLALSPASGGALPQAFFGDPGGRFVTSAGQLAAGLALNATGSPAIVTTIGPGAGSYLVVPTAGGNGAVRPVRPLATGLGTRLSWVRKR